MRHKSKTVASVKHYWKGTFLGVSFHAVAHEWIIVVLGADRFNSSCETDNRQLIVAVNKTSGSWGKWTTIYEWMPSPGVSKGFSTMDSTNLMWPRKRLGWMKTSFHLFILLSLLNHLPPFPEDHYVLYFSVVFQHSSIQLGSSQQGLKLVLESH